MSFKKIIPILFSISTLGLSGNLLVSGLMPGNRQREVIQVQENSQDGMSQRGEGSSVRENQQDEKVSVPEDSQEEEIQVQSGRENAGIEILSEQENTEPTMLTDKPDTENIEADFNIGGSSEKWSKAMEAYKRLLSKNPMSWIDDQPVGSGTVQFMTEDLNNDGIPELIVDNLTYNREYTPSTIGKYCIYSYHHGYADPVSFSELPMTYYPGTGVITASFETRKGDTYYTSEKDYVYLRNSSELTGVRWVLQIGMADMESDGSSKYYWLGIYDENRSEDWAKGFEESLSKEAFEACLEELTAGVQEKELQGNWLDNTEENREKYLR